MQKNCKQERRKPSLQPCSARLANLGEYQDKNNQGGSDYGSTSRQAHQQSRLPRGHAGGGRAVHRRLKAAKARAARATMRELRDDAARKRVAQCCRGRPVPVPIVVLVSSADFSDGVLECLTHLVVSELLYASRRERRRLRGYEVVCQIRAGSLQRADDDDRAFRHRPVDRDGGDAHLARGGDLAQRGEQRAAARQRLVSSPRLPLLPKYKV